MSSLSLNNVTFAWPDGALVLDGVTLAFPPGRTGLVGRNGTGKTTVLHLLSGTLRPASGTVASPDGLVLVEQDVSHRDDSTVADLLGITPALHALGRIEAGSVDPDDYDAVGEDWDTAERACAELASVGLPVQGADFLERTAATLSGGEITLAAIAGALLRRPTALLLDEPSNNLDAHARGILARRLASYRGIAVVAGHDRELLDSMDRTVELYHGNARMFDGGYSVYQAAIEAEQSAAQQAVKDASASVRAEQRQLAATETKVARRLAAGKRAQARGDLPRIVAGARKSASEASSAGLRQQGRAKLDEARQELAEARDAIRKAPEIHIDLPETAVHTRRQVAHATWQGAPVDIMGPQRIAVTGPNGAGKTTLLHQLDALVPCGFLPQNLGLLEDSLTVLDAVAQRAPHASAHQLRADLAALGFRGGRVELQVGSLSGGERVRATLAALLLSQPAPQLLILDEPTNNLDVHTLTELSQALACYRGALVVVSHDHRFLADLCPTEWWEMDADGSLARRAA